MDLYSCRLPLFRLSDDQQGDVHDFEQLEPLTIPLSATLLEVLHNFSWKEGSFQHVTELLDEIVKSPSYLFPNTAMIFERQGVSAFVPDDNQYHSIDWRAIILQVHISVLEAVGWAGLQRRPSSMFKSPSDELAKNETKPVESVGSQVGSRAHAPGSLLLRPRAGCVASFRDRPSAIGMSKRVESLKYEVAPALDRPIGGPVAVKDRSTMNLETNPLLNFQLQPSLENALFRAIILAVNSRGYLDLPLGYMLCQELHQDFVDAGINLGKIVDATQVFEDYYASVMKTLLSAEAEDEINDAIGQDNIGDVLARLEALYPYDCVPHAAEFLQSVLQPLCYHENPSFAERAIKQSLIIANGHTWDIEDVEVITAENKLEFRKTSEHVVVVSAPSGGSNAFTVLRKKEMQPTVCGFYDYCYARLAPNGAIEIDQAIPPGRYIVIPASAKKEIIHEVPAFDDKGPVPFEKLTGQLQGLVEAGVTAVHVPGAIERCALHDLTSVMDHTILSKACGGLDDFKEFCERAKSLGIRVLIDFVPLVSLASASRKYTPYGTLVVDARGKLVTADIPGTEMMLLNFRSVKFWSLLAKELEDICKSCSVSGFFFGHVNQWDTVYERDLKELLRIDPDGVSHYDKRNIIEGTVVLPEENCKVNCGMLARRAKCSPQLITLMKRLWAQVPDAFCWIQCEVDQEPFVCNSGLIPANYEFRTVMQSTIEHSVHCEDVDYVNANEALIKFYDRRAKQNPKGSFGICPFGGLMDGPTNMPMEGMQLAVDMLFLLTEVPLLSGCLESAMFVENAYATIKPEKPKVETAADGTPLTTPPPPPKIKKPSKWWPPTPRMVNYLRERAGARTSADWALGGDVTILPVSYDSHSMRAVLCVARVCRQTKKCALICMSFYKWNLIYEASVRSLDILKSVEPNSIVEITPLHNPAKQPSYYAINEVTEFGSSLFMDLDAFQTELYEINIITQIPPNIKRILMEEVLLRLERAIQFDSNTVLCNNMVFNSILQCIESETAAEKIENLVQAIQGGHDIHEIFREALFFATRNKKEDQLLKRIEDESVIQERETKALDLMYTVARSQIDYIRDLGKKALASNNLGPICFVAPELGPFSKVGGLSTMVWELAKELVQIGLDVSVISPYYNVSPKGETDYLKKYGIEWKMTIDVFAPSQIQIGIHYGVVDGVKCWFLHHHSFFAAPYQTGSPSFRLQLLVLMAKASLELCCQTRIIPALIISNDWMTGLVPAFGKKQFGTTFDGTKFLHIFHNLGAGYAGKLWPSDGDTGALRYIHQLPDELIVDPFDHSFDPSRCALLAADQWATVSKRYRDELREGSPYRDLLNAPRFRHPFAYSNGIRFEERLEALKKLGMNHDEAKRAVQQKYFGEVDDNKCLFVFVGRIVEQKGVYLIVDTFEELNRQYNGQLQFIVGGQAAPDDRSYGIPLTHRMWDLKNRYPKNFWADPSQFFSDGLLCCQAADYTLVPSLFEPSGIVQQEAFASGCPVIAFRTGGLADTVFEYNRETGQGNGLVFWSHHHKDFIMAVQRAMDLFYDKPTYYKLRKNAFDSTLSTVTVATAWAREFARLFMKIYESPAHKAEQEAK